MRVIVCTAVALMGLNTASALAEEKHSPANKAHANVEHMKPGFSIYGQSEKMLLVYDDGKDTETNIVDNSIGGTLFGFEGEQELGNGLTGSFAFEVSIADPTSGDIQQNTTAGQASTPVTTAATFGEELARVGLAGDWGLSV